MNTIHKQNIIHGISTNFNKTITDFLYSQDIENADLVVEAWNSAKHQQNLESQITLLLEEKREQAKQIEKLFGSFVTDFLFENTENSDLVIENWESYINQEQ